MFRTPIGFHDAYVAAPSRKAALEAWGSSTDLFSAGIAEEVKPPSGKAAKAALAKPGAIIRVGRQGASEDRPSARPAPASKTRRRKPSRAALDKAEAAMAALEERQAAERAALAKEEEALATRRRALEERHAKARDKMAAKRDAADERYRAAMRGWAG